MSQQQNEYCIIDLMAAKKEKAYIVFEDQHFIAFLDHRPLFPGHTLLAPKNHYKTLYDLPDSMVGSFLVSRPAELPR